MRKDESTSEIPNDKLARLHAAVNAIGHWISERTRAERPIEGPPSPECSALLQFLDGSNRCERPWLELDTRRDGWAADFAALTGFDEANLIKAMDELVERGFAIRSGPHSVVTIITI